MKYCLWLLLMGSSVYAQPKNMKEAMVYLDRECADSLKTVIKEGIPVDLRDIKIADWLDNRKSKLNRYLLHKGIHTEQKVIIITAYKDHLLGKPLDEDVLYTPWLKLEEKHHRDTAAYLKGTYIPKDLNDAIVQIDKMWDDKTKQQNKKIAYLLDPKT